jgi:hypothetical protein
MKTIQKKSRSTIETAGASAQHKVNHPIHDEVNNLLVDVEPPHSENEWNNMGFRIYVHKRKHIVKDHFLVWHQR